MEAHKVAKIIKELYPKAHIIFGGAHASAIPEIILKDESIDIVVIGEGEMTFLNIVDNVLMEKDISEVKGIVFKKNGKIIKTPPREFIQHLDILPFPARHLLPMHIYLNDPRAHMYAVRSPRTSIITSRGCPFNCVFCSIHSVWGRKWRARSPKNVADEIEFLVEKYRIRELAILDDNFTLDKKRVMRICNEIITRHIDIKWSTPNGIAFWTLDKEVLTMMKKSGYYRATFGIESGCKETLNFVRKPVNLNYARKVIKFCNDIGLWTHSTFVIGFPNETLDSINQTIEFAKKSGLDFATFYIATPYPGTDLYGIFKKNGLIKNESLYDSVTKTSHNTRYFKSEELIKLANKAHIEFLKYRILNYFKPNNLVKLSNKLGSVEDLRYMLKIGLNGLKIVLNALVTGEVDYFSKTRLEGGKSK
jgi:magnesium-protoporphyrin IX monomethyl ester (oxidative) cyclase